MKKIIYSLCILWLTTYSIVALKKQELFYFQFENEELVEIVHRLAAKKEMNIIFPVKSPITSKVTMFIEEPFTLDEAWEKLYTLLDLAGYSLINKETQCTIVKTEKDISKDALPIYIGISPNKLPDSDERIRYVYYLSNLKVNEIEKSEVGIVLKELLPENANFLADPVTNAIIISDKANNIKAAMEIITKLDSATYQETFNVIKLHNTDPKIVGKLFEDILKTSSAQYRFEPKKQLSENSYFPKNVRTYPLPRTNSLLVLGTQAAIDRIRDFIVKYIDVELESGKSILHIYKLQYMDANQIAEVLKKVLGLDKGGSGQSSGDGGKAPINPATQERSFDQIIIKTDVPAEGSGKDQYFGNNNIIAAARNDDWVRIKSLIEQLDQAQPQVIIEVLIVNLTLQEIRSLGSLSNNPLELGFPNGVNIQSAQIGNSAIVNPLPAQVTPPATSLATDLMGDTTFNGSSSIPEAPVTNVLSPGSTVVAINNGATGTAWSVLQLLDLFSYTKVIAHPHLIATNNKEASVAIGQTRLLNDQTTGSGGGTTVIKLKDIPAIYTVKIKPRIFTSATPGGKDDAVNLQVRVDIQDFLPGTNTANARLTRQVDTCALLKNGQILALGGLIDHEIDDSLNGTPILEKIPILGWLAKSRATTRIDSNLTIFIAPTIIEPRLRGGTGKYTEDYVGITKRYSQDAELFDSLQDPVTRWFFKRPYSAQDEIRGFMNQDEFKRQGNMEQYKSLVDAEQAAVVQDNNKPAKDKKNVKRIVLTNVDDKNAEQPTQGASNTSTEKVIEKDVQVCAIEKPAALANHDIITTPTKLQPENIAIASADAVEKHKAILKDKFQKLLQAEDNPLL